MSDSMVERVAKALHDADWRQQVGLTPDGAPRSWDTNPEQEWWRTQARAAVAAMREPTEGMLEYDAPDDHPRVHRSCHMCGGAEYQWRAMIDATLQEAGHDDKA